jgi:hypothetical protein
MKAHQVLHHRCPLCQSGLSRVRRSFLDRVFNLFVPVLRYRCASVHCGWEGLARRQAGRLGSQRYTGRQVLEPSRLRRDLD